MAKYLCVGLVLVGAMLMPAGAATNDASLQKSEMASRSSADVVPVGGGRATTNVADGGSPRISLQKGTMGTPAIPENKNLKTFDFEIQRGQCVFVGHDAGTLERYDVAHGTNPVFFIMASRQSTEEKMTLRVLVDLKDGKLASFPWDFKAVLFTRKDHEGPATSWHDEADPYTRLFSRGAKRLVELVPVVAEEVKAPDATVKKYKIPYLKVDGEIRYISVVIGDKQEDIKALVKIPQTFAFFQWEKALTECK